MAVRRGAALAALAIGSASAWAWCAAGSWEALWSTPAQAVTRRLERGAYGEAAELAARLGAPLLQGEALFRDGSFKEAAQAYARVDTEVGAFNRGTALIMAGQYRAALEAFDRALALRPGWEAAEVNRGIAEARLARLEAAEERGARDAELSPDEVVFDPNAEDAEDEVEVGAGEELDDASIRALWLRRISTSPADFLRAKFARQHAARSERRQE